MYRFFLLGILLVACSASAADTASVQIETVTLKQQPMVDTVSGYGIVSSGTQSLQNISLPRSGQVMSLLVSAGQVVKKGMPLLEFSTGAEAIQSYQQARQAVEFARREVARTEQLVSQQLATQSQLATARKTEADAKASLITQEKIGAGLLMERINAPFDGVVANVQAVQGDRLTAGMPVLQLTRVGGQRVLLGIEPKEVVMVRAGMAVSISPVFNTEHKVDGRVSQVFGIVNPQTQFVDVLVEVPGGGLMLGTRVSAEVQLSRQVVWVVPRSAVLRDAQGYYIFQVHQGAARRVKVKAGLEQNGLIAVQGGFVVSEPVISLGNYELHDGMTVRWSRP